MKQMCMALQEGTKGAWLTVVMSLWTPLFLSPGEQLPREDQGNVAAGQEYALKTAGKTEQIHKKN